MTARPLVSVIVVACNSSRYVRDTLDSVLAQTYDRLELIVTDDASTDDTVSIAERWLSVHGSRFVSSSVVRSAVNTGIAGNCNRALARAGGEWIKLIAADDLLLPDCLELGIRQAAFEPAAAVIFSRMKTIDEHGELRGEYAYPASFFAYPPERQLRHLLHRNCLAAPTALIRMTDLGEMGLFDEDYPMLEDLPLWVKMLERGKRLSGLAVPTVCYRVHQSLVYPVIGKRNKRYQQSVADWDKRVRLPLARRLSPLLYATVGVDLLVDYIVQRRWLYRLSFPVLWVWARYSPYRVTAKQQPDA